MEMTLVVTGVICVLFGLIGFVGQLISSVDFRLAQKLGLQETDAQTDPLHRHLELNAARWDLAVLWVLPLAGCLMLLGHAWWPFVALVAGGISVDTTGRECVKILGLREHGVKTGSKKETRLYFGFMALKLLIGVWCIAYSLATII
jgi:hypothetical protein